MLTDKKYIYDNIFYIKFKKHHCPHCGKRLSVVTEMSNLCGKNFTAYSVIKTFLQTK